jgi:hypothetical protein
MRFRLRTLLIAMAIVPPVSAGAYWTWEWSRPSPWIIDGGPYFLPHSKRGYRWKLTQQGLIEVLDDPSPSDE